MINITEEEIIKNWHGDISKPVVSICCATYNHENYIAEALDGFLMQKIDFSFEVIVRDDASSDKTAAIIKEYEAKYPKIIKPIYEKENTYSKGIKPFGVILTKAIGKYIAMCDGDDYWTDPSKLQKQVDFLENNPDYVISGHDAVFTDKKGKIIEGVIYSEKHKKDFSQEEVMSAKSFTLTLTMVFRKVVDSFPLQYQCSFNGDRFITCFLGQFGKSHYHHDIQPAMHRQHPGGIWSSISKDKKNEHAALTYMLLFDYFKKQHKPTVASELWKIATFYMNTKNNHEYQQNENYSYHAVVKSLSILLELNPQNEYFIYGYGTIGTVVEKVLGKSIVGILDKDFNVNEMRTVNDIPIYQSLPSNLRDNQYVIITPYLHLKEIQLDLNISDEKIIILSSNYNNFSSNKYWEDRYAKGGNSGAGSYKHLAEFKAEVINNFIQQYGINKALEFGCGDGNNLSLYNIENYVGVDVSNKAIEICKSKFSQDFSKTFLTLEAFMTLTDCLKYAKLVISLDVIYHLIEDSVYHEYMNNLFDNSLKYVIIYASNYDEVLCAHVKHRKFTDWVEKYKQDWTLKKFIKNRYPYDSQNQAETTFADFYIFEKS